MDDMTSSDNPIPEVLERVGAEVRASHDSALAGSDVLAAGRMAFLSASARRKRDVPRSVRVSSVAAAFSLAAAAVVALLAFSPDRLNFVVGTRPGVVGAWIAAKGGSHLPLVFSDGSSFLLEQGAEARVTELRTRGAEVLVERGRVEAHVVPASKASWDVNAGPYRVHVTGTRFEVSWDPVGHTFGLELYEGSVVVNGCEVVDRAVRAGQSLYLACDDNRRASVEAANAAAQSTREQSADAGALQAPASSAEPPPSSEPPHAKKPEMAIDGPPRMPADTPMPPVSEKDPRSTWRERMIAGNPREAMIAAEPHFSALCVELSSDDLLLLADAARFAGQPHRAREAWGSVRARFPNDARADAKAAFFLGRADLESGDARSAAGLLEASLREDPDGPLAREAAGRLIEAEQASGDMPAAKQAARSYLSKYPTGPHATLAASLVAAE